MSDIPETDAYIGDDNDDNMTEGEIAMCEFARRLERERNEARKEAELLRDAYEEAVVFAWEGVEK
jgi:hypothetical protein